MAPYRNKSLTELRAEAMADEEAGARLTYEGRPYFMIGVRRQVRSRNHRGMDIEGIGARLHRERNPGSLTHQRQFTEGSMKIEAGKKYRTVDGRCVELRKSNNHAWPFTGDAWCSDYWSDGEGRAAHAFAGQSYSHKYGGKGDGANLIAEWTDGPVREVTRKEIAIGRFGVVCITAAAPGKVCVDIDAPARWKSASELRAAASTLTAIADALEEAK